jgi:hypothetical protein
MSGEIFWSGVWFSYKKDLKWDAKTKTGNIDPLLKGKNNAIKID